MFSCVNHVAYCEILQEGHDDPDSLTCTIMVVQIDCISCARNEHSCIVRHSVAASSSLLLKRRHKNRVKSDLYFTV